MDLRGAESWKEQRESVYSVPTVAVEGNLIIFPIFLLSKRNPGRKGWFSYRRTILHHPPGGEPQRIEQEWIVNGSHRWGLARALDLDVCMALTEIANLRGGMPDDGRVWFSLYGLKELLGWSGRASRAYELIRESLERTAATTITSRRAFWSPRLGNFVSRAFSLWDCSINYAWDVGGRRSERHNVRFDELVVESYQGGHTTRLDPSFYRSLTHSTAKRLYMLADYHCASEEDGRSRVWEVTPGELVECMPLADYSRSAKVEQVLERAHEELVHAGYLEDVEIERGKRNAPLLFRYKQAAAFARKRLGAEIERDPEGAIALAKLQRERVNRAVAVDLVSEFGPAYCGEYADLLAFIPNVKPAKGAGLLVKAIRNGWDWKGRVAKLPKGRAVRSVPWVAAAPPGEAEVIESVAPGEGYARAAEHDPEPVAEELWAEVLEDALRESGGSSLGGWFEDAVATSLENERLTLSIPNIPAKEYIERRFGEILEKALKKRLSDRATIEYEVRDGGQRQEA